VVGWEREKKVIGLRPVHRKTRRTFFYTGVFLSCFQEQKRLE
jgi:hypothetical protein